jgi:hypothetical protein
MGLNILSGRGPAAAWFTLFVTRAPRHYEPDTRQPVKAFESRAANLYFLELRKFLIRPVCATATRSFAPGLSGSAHPIGIDSVIGT